MYQARVYGQRANGETFLAGTIDLKTHKFTEINYDNMSEIKGAIHDNLTEKVNDMVNQDPSIQFVYKE